MLVMVTTVPTPSISETTEAMVRPGLADQLRIASRHKRRMIFSLGFHLPYDATVFQYDDPVCECGARRFMGDGDNGASGVMHEGG